MHKKYYLSLFLFLQIIGLQIIKHYPEFVETYYSNSIYPIISSISRTTTGIFTFSLGDIIYSSLILRAIYWLYKKRKENWRVKLLGCINTIAIFYFIFHILWGLNYYRLPLTEKLHLKSEYSQQELIDFTKKMIAKTNEIHFQITKDTAKKVISPYTPKKIFNLAPLAYTELKKELPYFTYTKPSIKSSIFKYPLSYSGIGGYLNPFTNEAQVNTMPPIYNLPAVTTHEMAHQIGFGSETDCNFIGFLAATHHKDIYFKYSAYTYALRYCLSAIAFKEEKELDVYLKQINPGVLKNIKENKEFYEKYKSFLDTAFEFVYDRFLKMNQQDEGIDSYSRFIDLLINYSKHKNIF